MFLNTLNFLVFIIELLLFKFESGMSTLMDFYSILVLR